MPGYTEEELAKARAPLRSEQDRGLAVCTLGHMLTEQREAYTAERAAIVTEITAAVQDFDTRKVLGATAGTFAGSSGAQPVAHVPDRPAPLSPTSVPTATADLLAKTMQSRVQASASMHRELKRQGLGSADPGSSRIDVLSASRPREPDLSASSASMQRELRRAGLVPRD